MGLSEVNVPLLYGEGHKAFLRLQRQIAKDSADDTLFAWHIKTAPIKWLVSGMFPARPAFFAGCQDLIAPPDLNDYRTPHTLTNKRLALDAYYKTLLFEEFAHQIKHLGGPTVADREIAQCRDYYLLPLMCARDRDLEKAFTIILWKKSPTTFVRIFPWEKEAFQKYFKQAGSEQHQTMYIQTPTDFSVPSIYGKDHPLQALKEWYVTTRGHVKPSHYRWRVYLPAVLWFAILSFKRDMGESFTVFLDFGPGEEELGMHVILEICADTGHFAETVHAYKATFDATLEADALLRD
ncbi:MAG: hypothetical protein Q9184_007596 [Pyrenodesmia sp. 2 TL-2023]